MKDNINQYIGHVANNSINFRRRLTKMKLIHFAVASIIDANTGYRLTSAGGGNHYAAAEQHAREIRAKTVATLITKIKARLSNTVSTYRAHALQRRGLAELSRLDDRLLRDIGLTRGDLVAVERGHTDFDELATQRRAENIDQTLNLASHEPVLEFEAANEADYGAQKCA